MSYSVLLNSNSPDANNLGRTRDILNDLVNAYTVDPSKITCLGFDINEIDILAQWANNLVRLMNVTGSTEDVILEPAELIEP